MVSTRSPTFAEQALHVPGELRVGPEGDKDMAATKAGGTPADRTVRPLKANKPMTVFGRQGSPTLTLALPFSHVDVKADDGAAMALVLATLTARLARALESAGLGDATAEELSAIAAALDALANPERAREDRES
jgi:hypothetical protein